MLLSLYSDKSTVDQEFCGNWQLFWTYLRSTLELAAVSAALEEPLSQSWGPGIAVLRPSQAVLGPGKAVQGPRKAVRTPREAQQARGAGPEGSPRATGGFARPDAP